MDKNVTIALKLNNYYNFEQMNKSINKRGQNVTQINHQKRTNCHKKIITKREQNVTVSLKLDTHHNVEQMNNSIT